MTPRPLSDPRHPCHWKRRYATWDDAEEACFAYQGTGKPVTLAYRCTSCGEWHVCKAGTWPPIPAFYYSDPGQRPSAIRDLYDRRIWAKRVRAQVVA